MLLTLKGSKPVPYACLIATPGYAFRKSNAVSWPRGAAPVKRETAELKSYFAQT
jgi:hypothetical protein